MVFIATDGLNEPAQPANWFLKLSISSFFNAMRLSAFAKRADGTEGGTTVNFSTSGSCSAAAQCWRIKNGSDRQEAGASFASGNSANPNPDNNTFGSANADTLWIAVMGVDNDSAGTITSYPTNYSLNQTETNSVVGSATDPTLGCAARQLNAASEDAGAFTTASGAWAAFNFAILPYTSIPPFQSTTPRVWRTW